MPVSFVRTIIVPNLISLATTRPRICSPVTGGSFSSAVSLRVIKNVLIKDGDYQPVH